MEHLEKRLSYVKGFADGLEINETSKEGKILTDVIAFLDDLMEEMRELHDRIDDCEDYVGAIDQDLSEMEYDFYDCDECDDLDVADTSPRYMLEDEEGNYYDLDDSEDAHVYDQGYTSGEETTLNSYEIECPNCREVIFFQESLDEDGFIHYTIEPLNEAVAPINPT